jgi:hypothetical protein
MAGMDPSPNPDPLTLSYLYPTESVPGTSPDQPYNPARREHLDQSSFDARNLQSLPISPSIEDIPYLPGTRSDPAHYNRPVFLQSVSLHRLYFVAVRSLTFFFRIPTKSKNFSEHNNRIFKHSSAIILSQILLLIQIATHRIIAGWNWKISTGDPGHEVSPIIVLRRIRIHRAMFLQDTQDLPTHSIIREFWVRTPSHLRPVEHRPLVTKTTAFRILFLLFSQPVHFSRHEPMLGLPSAGICSFRQQLKSASSLCPTLRLE